LFAQNPIFRLPHVNNAYINPALVGFGHYDEYQATRIQTAVKAQWVGINRRLNSSHLGADIPTQGNSSWGVSLLNTDFVSAHQGQGSRYNHLAGQITYAYLIPTESIKWKFGLSLQGANYTFGNNNFTWGDQINEDMTAFSRATQEPIANLSTFSMQAAAGIMAVGKNWFLGLSAFNINQPNISFFESTNQPLYRKFIAHGGIKIQKEFYATSFTPTFVYSSQYQTQNLALDAVFQNGNLFYGLGSIQSRLNQQNTYSLHTFFNVRKEGWVIGYDMDFNMGLRSNTLPLTHEFNIIYLIKSRSLKKAVFKHTPLL
jgi:type IX secretion system PorP/SprF family membrane protein